MIQLLPIFYGMENEHVYSYTREFEEVCGTFSDQTRPQDVIRLKLFPFSLKEKQKYGFYLSRLGSISTWHAMHEAFLKKFFPNHLTSDLMHQIKLFTTKKVPL